MAPTLHHGDKVFAFRYLHGRAGDIVVARHKSILVIKRVQRVKDRQYWLLGDNPRRSIDSRHFGPVNKKDILAVVFSRGAEFKRKSPF